MGSSIRDLGPHRDSNCRVQTLYTMILNAMLLISIKTKENWSIPPSGKSANKYFLPKYLDPIINIHFNATRMFDITGVTFIKVVCR